jgi:cation diffusion facilitator family transporter
MTPARFHFPDGHAALRDRSKRVARVSIWLLSSAAAFLALTLGQSQAMKTSWVSDVLSIVPPIGLLVAAKYELRQPTRRFPYGYTRAISIAFLLTASVLTLIGVMLLVDALMKLVEAQRPPIGTLVVAGHQLWAGWMMMLALAYSMGCGMLVGRLKKPLAAELHDKELDAESQMNGDEWLSEGVAIVGLLLVAFGWWWADSAAAAIVAVQIVRDGWYNVRQVIGDLMDEAPTIMGRHDLEDLPDRVRAAAERLDWVAAARVRLREHGRLIVGEIFVVPRDADDLVNRVERAVEQLEQIDWRLHMLTIMPVSKL